MMATCVRTTEEVDLRIDGVLCVLDARGWMTAHEVVQLGMAMVTVDDTALVQIYYTLHRMRDRGLVECRPRMNSTAYEYRLKAENSTDQGCC